MLHGMGKDQQWAVEQELGKGSFATVYKLVHTPTAALISTESKFALKVIDGQWSSPQDHEEICKEFRLMRRLSHPHVVILLDSFEVEGRQHLVLELCEGGDLRTFLDTLRERRKANGQVMVGVKETQVIRWTQQLADALQYLHEGKVLHRDLKPQNILLKNEEHLKIGDLGIARQLFCTQEMVMSYKGTPLYMSPEIYKGSPYSYKTDIWSLGCCVHEMMSLHYAFNAVNRYQVAWAIMDCKVTPLPTCYSPQLQSLVMSLLDKDPDVRPSAAAIVCTVQDMQGSALQRCRRIDVPKEERNFNTAVLKTCRQEVANALFRFLSKQHAAQSSTMAYLASTTTNYAGNGSLDTCKDTCVSMSLQPEAAVNFPINRQDACFNKEQNTTEGTQRIFGTYDTGHESTVVRHDQNSVSTTLPTCEVSHDVESIPENVLFSKKQKQCVSHAKRDERDADFSLHEDESSPMVARVDPNALLSHQGYSCSQNAESSAEILPWFPLQCKSSSEADSTEKSEESNYPDLNKLTSEEDCKAYAREILSWARTRLITLQETEASKSAPSACNVDSLKEPVAPHTNNTQEKQRDEYHEATQKKDQFKKSTVLKEQTENVGCRFEKKGSHQTQNRSEEPNETEKKGMITLFTRSQRVTFKKTSEADQLEGDGHGKEIIHQNR